MYSSELTQDELTNHQISLESTLTELELMLAYEPSMEVSFDDIIDTIESGYDVFVEWKDNLLNLLTKSFAMLEYNAYRMRNLVESIAEYARAAEANEIDVEVRVDNLSTVFHTGKPDIFSLGQNARTVMELLRDDFNNGIENMKRRKYSTVEITKLLNNLLVSGSQIGNVTFKPNDEVLVLEERKPVRKHFSWKPLKHMEAVPAAQLFREVGESVSEFIEHSNKELARAAKIAYDKVNSENRMKNLNLMYVLSVQIPKLILDRCTIFLEQVLEAFKDRIRETTFLERTFSGNVISY